jgi:hypothetical protein
MRKFVEPWIHLVGANRLRFLDFDRKAETGRPKTVRQWL